MIRHRLDAASYQLACDLAGAGLLRRLPAGETVLRVLTVGVWDNYTAGVYLAADRDNWIRYVGSAIRSGSDSVGDRIGEHMRCGRADGWTRLMLVPLRADLSVDRVRRIEGVIGRVLRPMDNHRLPALTSRP
ncbi:hypothetical protein [Micromonospora sp. NPDC002717]|uniref:hypothetical protein n=1 Tax=Micromonospora sp. NPDC002717 TaxID=3154424 RepID=UPI00331AFC2A